MINLGGSASNAVNSYHHNNQRLSSAMEKLSTGRKINSASNDPAGYVMSAQLQSSIFGTQRAMQNTQETNNVLAIAEGALASIANPLAKVKQLAIHAANSGVTSQDQVKADQAEVNGILNAVQKIATTTTYSNKNLLNGTSSEMNLQLTDSVGRDKFGLPNISLENLGRVTVETPVYETAVNDAGETVYKYGADGNKIRQLDADGKPVTASKTYSMKDLYSGGAAALAENPEIAMQIVDQAQRDISGYRASIGAYQQNTLEANANSLAVAMENIIATESEIGDADIAKLSTEQATADILTKASIFGIQKLNENAGRYLQLLGIDGGHK
ncbi:flagellin [Planctomycetales bacterium]|nr:flagellin [Planctomycetales bacterium]